MNTEIFAMPVLTRHKEQSEFCRSKLKEICKCNYDYDFTDEQIGRNAHGKPYFIENEHLHFNISHTQGMGVIVTDDKPCGVDIEKMKQVKLSMAKRFFTEAEYLWIEAAEDEKEQQRRFFTVWTGKEAYSKMLGCGLTMEMSSYSVLDEKVRCLLRYMEQDGYIICVCGQDTEK